MSIANLFVPNDLNLFCGTLTQMVEPSPMDGSITLTDLTDQIICGVLPNTTTLNAPSPTSSITLTFPNVGSDTLVARNTMDTLTNKIIANTSNNITVGGIAIGSLLNQDVRTTASPSFVGETLTGIVDDDSSTQLLALNGTSVVYRNVSSLPIVNPFNQSLNTTNSATFASETLSNTSNQLVLGTTNTTTLNSPAPGSSIVLTLPSSTNDTLIARATTDTLTNKTIADTANTVTVGGTAIGLLVNQDVRTTSSPTFVNPVASSIEIGTLLFSGVPGSTPGVLINQGMGTIDITSMPSGQIVIGDAGLPVIGSLTGTNITITPGAGTLNVGIPQSVATSATPTFANIIDNGLTIDGIVYANSSKQLVSASALTNGQMLIGSTGAAPVVGTISGSANIVVSVGAGTLSLNTQQNLTTGSSPTFTGLNAGGTVPQVVNVQYHLNTSQSISNAAATVINFDTADFTNSAISYASGVFTINTAGKYTVTAMVAFASSATGFRSCFFQLNGGSVNNSLLSENPITGQITAITTAYTSSLSATSTIAFNVFQNSGGALNAIGLATTSTIYCQINITGVIPS